MLCCKRAYLIQKVLVEIVLAKEKKVMEITLNKIHKIGEMKNLNLPVKIIRRANC